MISLCLIAKNEESNIKNALDSVEKFVDEICVTDTGSTDKTKFVLEHLSYADKIKISDFNPQTNPEAFFDDGGIYNFAAARQFNFEQATGDWILWMDCDDVILNPQNLEALIKVADQQKIDGYFVWYHYQLKKDGSPSEKHWKMQLVRNDQFKFAWKGNVHEDILFRGAYKLAKTESITRVHVKGDATSGQKMIRNVRILNRQLEEQGDNPDPRTLFYLARAYMTDRDMVSAIPILESYLELSGWREERYEAYWLLSEAYMELGKFEEARQSCLKAIESRPDFPDCYFSMARIYVLEGEFNKAKDWCENGFTKRASEEQVTQFRHRYTSQPLLAYAIILLNLGKLDEALTTIQKALKYEPEDQNLIDTQKLIEHVRTRRDVAKSYLTIASYLKDSKDSFRIPTILGTVPEDLNDNGIIAKLKYDWMKPKTWPKKSVAILAFGSVEEWSPKNEKKGGIGGSEEAVINLSKELHKLGWKVTVFTNTGPNSGVYNGVSWKMWTEFNGKDEFDALVLWRHTGLIDYELKARKIMFDIHDVPQYGDWNDEKLKKVTSLMVKTQYHRSLLPEVPDDKVNIVNNGINPKHFEHKIERESFRCIYSSTIDRGLDILLELWPRIRAEVPEATLHVYYGFNTYRALNKNNPERMRFLAKIEKKLETTEGVFYHGRVDHETLAKEMLKSDVWLYPTFFPEISCITAMKAQAAGAVPVCTNFAALKETVQYGEKIEGDIYLPEIQDEFVRKAVETLKGDKPYRQEMMDWARKNFAWSEVAKAWSNLME